MIADKNTLRSRYQLARLSLDPSVRTSHDRQIVEKILACCVKSESDRVAAYLAVRGEPDLSDALHELYRQGRRIYLPVVRNSDMQFRAWTPDARLVSNRYGIAEPVDGDLCAVAQLEQVLMPLVAFDARGVRLGMGGGFYDRCFAFKINTNAHSPRMVGIGYSIQQHIEPAGLPCDPWDVRLDGVITEQDQIEFS